MRSRGAEVAAVLPAQRDLRAAALRDLSLPGLRLLPLRVRDLSLPGLRLHMRVPALRLHGVRVRKPAVSRRRAERSRSGEGLDRVSASGDAHRLPALRRRPEGLAASAGTRVLLGDQSPQEAATAMSDTTVETDQAAREASGAHPYGRYLEDFEVGAVYKHWPAKTITEADDHLFCLLTMNHHPLHINDVYARASQQGRNVVVGPLVYSLALGMSVSDVSGKAIANLATEELKHPAPVFHGDTLFCESEVLEKKESQSKPDRGTVKVQTRVLNQDGVLVAEFKRLVLVPRKNPGPQAAEQGELASSEAVGAKAEGSVVE